MINIQVQVNRCLQEEGKKTCIYLIQIQRTRERTSDEAIHYWVYEIRLYRNDIICVREFDKLLVNWLNISKTCQVVRGDSSTDILIRRIKKKE